MWEGGAPAGFPGTGPLVGRRGGPLPRGGPRPEERGPGSRRGSWGPGPPVAPRARARRALHSPSLQQRLRREEGIRPSHTPPSDTRPPAPLAAPRSLALSRSHTRALAAAAPALAPALPPAPPGAAGLRTRPPAGAGAPAPRSAPRRQDGGAPGRSPR